MNMLLSHCGHCWCDSVRIHGSRQWEELLVNGVNKDNHLITTNQSEITWSWAECWMCHRTTDVVCFYCSRINLFPFLFSSLCSGKFLLPDHLLFGDKGERRSIKVIVTGQEGGITPKHSRLESWGAGSLRGVYPRAVHLRSGMPVCQAGGWQKEGAYKGKRAACMAWSRLHAAVSIPDPRPVSATPGITQGCNTGQWRASGAWRVPTHCHCFGMRETAWLQEFTFSFYLSC